MDRIRALRWPAKLGLGCAGLLVLWIAIGLVLSRGGQPGQAESALSCGSAGSGVQTCTRDMAFADCLGVVQATAEELGVAPINVVETSALRIVRFPTSDGSVLVTCSIEGQMGITRSDDTG